MSSWSDYDRVAFNSSSGSSLSSTPLCSKSSSMMRVGEPQISMAPDSGYSNGGIPYRPLEDHGFLHDIFVDPTSLTELDESTEDIVDPSQTESLAPDFSVGESYPILSIPHIMVAGVQDQGISYSTATTCEKGEHEIADFDYSNGSTLHNQLGGYHVFGDMPA
jgi:hypothetical protein